MEHAPAGEMRLAELVASLSLAVDLGLGQPMEHVLRQTVIALRLADRAGLGDEQREAAYYVSLLAWVGCIADSSELAHWFGDDIAMRSDGYAVDFQPLPMGLFMARHLGAGLPPRRRMALAGEFLRSKPNPDRVFAAHCESTGILAQRLGLGPDVVEPLGQTFERWDGKGSPRKLREEGLSPVVRVVHLADVVEVFHRLDGIDGAVAVAKERRGTQFDPSLVDLFCADPAAMFDGIDERTTWAAVLDAEMSNYRMLSGPEVDEALAAFADYVDLKSTFTLGHSRAVADLASRAAGELGLPRTQMDAVRQAGCIHDIGVIAVPNGIWERPGPLGESDLERVRTHPYLAERVLSRSAALRGIGSLAGMHHERLDGSGYPRGLAGDAIPTQARLLAAADVYQALIQARPHRPAYEPVAAQRILRDEVRSGLLDGAAVDAVLACAGHRVRRKPANPHGLTAREIEVLVLIAAGKTNKATASELGITPKTVGAHVEHIYSKLGISTRPAAALYAMRTGLIDAGS